MTTIFGGLICLIALAALVLVAGIAADIWLDVIRRSSK